MTREKLPQELISLAHHVALNETGWWDSALQHLVITTVALSTSGKPTLNGIAQSLKQHFHVQVDPSRLSAMAEALCAAEKLIPIDSDRYKVSEVYRSSLEDGKAEAAATEQAVLDRFRSIIRSKCPAIDPDDLWTQFNDDFLQPLVQEIGAYTIEMLTAPVTALDTPHLAQFLERHGEEHREDLRRALAEFLDPGNRNIRKYVLSYLQARLCVEASSLDEQTLDRIAKAQASRPRFRIVLDTNFIFSILELHQNPSNVAAASLMGIIKDAAQRADIQLVVMSVTIEEARTQLERARNSLGDRPIPPNLAEAEMQLGASGIQVKFLEECVHLGQSLSPKAYFDKYIEGLPLVLKEKGINVEAVSDDLIARTSVARDIREQVQLHEARRRDGKRFKGEYELKHDVVLWHAVNDRRPTGTYDVLDAENWVVTVDYTYLGFDTFKRQASAQRVPICLHPANLAQLLQFWIARTPKVERAMLNAMRIPFLFYDFSSEAERITREIAATLTHYEVVDRISADTLIQILTAKALRSKISERSTPAEKINLVNAALAEIAEKQEIDSALRKEAESLRESAEAKGELVEQLQTELLKKDQVLEERAGDSAKLAEITQALATEKSARETLEQEVARLKAAQLRRSLFAFCSAYLGLPLGITGVMTWLLASPISSRMHWPAWLVRVGLADLLLCGSLLLFSAMARRDEWPDRVRWVGKVEKLRACLTKASAAILASVVAGIILDVVLRKPPTKTP